MVGFRNTLEVEEKDSGVWLRGVREKKDLRSITRFLASATGCLEVSSTIWETSEEKAWGE